MSSQPQPAQVEKDEEATLAFGVAVFALLYPGLDDPASATWRLPLLAATTLLFHRYVTPGYHLIEEKRVAHD